MSPQRSAVNDSLPPWRVASVANIWNEYSRPLKLRQFSHGKGGTAARSAKRLTAILLDNAKLLEMSKHRDLEDLCDAFEATLQVALVAMAAQGLDAVNSSLGAQYTISMGFWQFTRPDISNLTTIANQALGRTPAVIAEQQAWRQQKRQLIDEFKAEVSDFIEQAVRLSGSDLEKLHRALHEARTGLANAEDALAD